MTLKTQDTTVGFLSTGSEVHSSNKDICLQLRQGPNPSYLVGHSNAAGLNPLRIILTPEKASPCSPIIGASNRKGLIKHNKEFTPVGKIVQGLQHLLGTAEDPDLVPSQLHLLSRAAG